LTPLNGISPVIDIGFGWKPTSILSHHADREDYQYVMTNMSYRASDTAPVYDSSGFDWESGELIHSLDDFNTLPWIEYPHKGYIDSTSRYVQIKVEYISTDELLRYPLILDIELCKQWWDPTGFKMPNDDIKYGSGVLDDLAETDFYGITLSPAIDSTSIYDGWWTSPIHDFGMDMHPRFASWYAFTPIGSYFDTIQDGGGTIQIRGSNSTPMGGWSQDHMPDPDDPIWGVGGSLENSWQNIWEGQMIPAIIGKVRYAQIRIKLGINV
jgi:hypothetical protein